MAGRSNHLDLIILWIYGFPLAVIADGKMFCRAEIDALSAIFPKNQTKSPAKMALSVCRNLDEAAIAMTFLSWRKGAIA